jgi:hypothetical protein
MHTGRTTQKTENRKQASYTRQKPARTNSNTYAAAHTYAGQQVLVQGVQNAQNERRVLAWQELPGRRRNEGETRAKWGSNIEAHGQRADTRFPVLHRYVTQVSSSQSACMIFLFILLISLCIRSPEIRSWLRYTKGSERTQLFSFRIVCFRLFSVYFASPSIRSLSRIRAHTKVDGNSIKWRQKTRNP